MPSVRKKNPSYKAALKKKVDAQDTEYHFFPTMRDCNRWFRILNQEIFDNMVREFDSIEIGPRRGVHAWTTAGFKDNVHLYTNLEMEEKYETFKLFLNVLAHEMVHAWQIQYKFPMGHGKSFNLWKEKFKSKGLTLATAYR